MPQGLHGLAGQAPQPSSGPPNQQAYNQGGTAVFNAGSQLQGEACAKYDCRSVLLENASILLFHK